MIISENKIGRVIFYPVIQFCYFLFKFNPVLLVKLRYFAIFHRLPRLSPPIDLNEKTLWLKLYSDTSRWTELADKVKVRKYIEEIGLKHTLIPLIGVWDDVRDIDFSKLPNELVFKANNGDGMGTNLVIKDLENFDKRKLKSKLDYWLKRKHVGELSGEPQYRGIKPQIIAEKLLHDSNSKGGAIIDYKFWCVNGEPQYVFTCSNRKKESGGAHVMTYDMQWNACPELSVFTKDYPAGEIMRKPKNFDEMILIARKISSGFPILRVDLYNIDGGIYFGEMTFTSQSGMDDGFTQAFMDELGKMADLSNVALK